MYLYCCCVLNDLQNSELEKIVKDLLHEADLEQVTMKSVCKQVSCQVSLTLYVGTCTLLCGREFSLV